MSEILGMRSDAVYAFLIILMLIILGVVTFHYYAYMSVGNGAAMSAGGGVGFTLLPDKKQQQ